MRSDGKVKEVAVEAIMQEWANETFGGHYVGATHGVVAYHINGSNLYLCTMYPGYFIGYKGVIIEKYRKLLRNVGITSIDLVDMYSGGLKRF